MALAELNVVLVQLLAARGGEALTNNSACLYDNLLRLASLEIAMSLDMPAYVASRRRFLESGAAFPVEELANYAGQWVAWSPDGTRVAASAPSPELLDGILEANGEDPAMCVVEGIPDDDALFGEADGSGA